MSTDLTVAGGRDLQLRAVNQLQRANVVAERGAFRALVTRVERVPLGFETTLHVQGPDSWARYAADPERFEARIGAIVAGCLGRAFNVQITSAKRGSIEMVLAFAMADPVTAMEILHDAVILAKTMAEVARAVVDLFADGNGATTAASPSTTIWTTTWATIWASTGATSRAATWVSAAATIGAGVGAWLWKRALTLLALLVAAVSS